MKVKFKNSDLVFMVSQLFDNGTIRTKHTAGSLSFLGAHLDAGTYYFNVDVSSNNDALLIQSVVGATATTIKTINPSEFGSNVEVIIPEGSERVNYATSSAGEYTISVKTVESYTKVGELTAASAYNNNRLFTNISVTADLATLLSGLTDVYIKVSDSNHLFPTMSGINCVKYASGTTTKYIQAVPFSVIAKSNNAVNTNVILQQQVDDGLTHEAGDTTIKIEFFSKDS